MSEQTSRDVYAHALRILAAAADASTEPDALLDVEALASQVPLELVRQVATCLAVEMVWRSRPRRSRRAFRDWVELRQFQAMTAPVRDTGGGS